MVSLRMTYVVSVAKEELFRVWGMVACVKSCWGFLLFLGEPSPGLFEDLLVLGVPPLPFSPPGTLWFRFAHLLSLLHNDSCTTSFISYYSFIRIRCSLIYIPSVPIPVPNTARTTPHHPAPAPDPPWYYNTISNGCQQDNWTREKISKSRKQNAP